MTAAESFLALKLKHTMDGISCHLESIAYINISLYEVRVMVFLK